MPEHAGAIGVFDSGVGGLTVVRELFSRLPDEAVLYLGDTARVPYGTKSPDTVVRYAFTCAEVLRRRGIKLLVVACNTASAHALEALRDALPIPVIGVVDPGARSAVAATRNNRVGVIGTVGTIGSNEYERTIASISPDVEVFCKPCPLFVPLAEEGWVSGQVPSLIAAQYLDELVARGIDTLLLGCTHYPLLREVIAEAIGDTIRMVDSAEATAIAVADTLEAMQGLSTEGSPPRHQFLVSDDPKTFERTGRMFLGEEVESVQWVDF